MLKSSHQFSLVNNLLDLGPQLTAAADLCPEKIPRGQVTDLEMLLQSRCLGPLPGPWRPQENGSDPVGWIVWIWSNSHFEFCN